MQCILITPNTLLLSAIALNLQSKMDNYQINKRVSNQQSVQFSHETLKVRFDYVLILQLFNPKGVAKYI